MRTIERSALLRRLKLLLPVVWAVAVLALIEFGLEFRAYQRGYQTPFFGRLQKGEATNNERKYGPTKAFPFRSQVVSANRIQEAPLIWVASASHAEDSYFSPDAIFPNLLEEILCETGCECHVINASHAGWTVGRNQQEFGEKQGMWPPQFVLIYCMSTDISYHSKETHFNADKSPNLRAAPSDSGSSPFSWQSRLIESTTSYELIKSNVSSRITACRVRKGNLNPAICEAYLASVAGFVEDIRQAGATPVICTFATSHTLNSIDDIPDEYAYGTYRYTPDLSMRSWVNYVKDLNDMLRRFAVENNVHLIDTEAMIGDRPEYFRDFVHFSEQGHQAVARCIASDLDKLIHPDSVGRFAP